MNPRQLRALMALAAARKARDLAQLDRLRGAVRAIEAEIAEAAATPGRDLAAGGQDEAPLALQGKRQRWADSAVAAGRNALAGLEAETAAARLAATRSLGKHSALEHLLARAERLAATAADARAENETISPAPARKP